MRPPQTLIEPKRRESPRPKILLENSRDIQGANEGGKEEMRATTQNRKNLLPQTDVAAFVRSGNRPQ